MRLQVVKDSKGNDSGVFIPMEEWELIKNTYPDVEHLDEEIPEWQKELLDKRLKAIAENPERLRPIEELFEELDNAE